jgi:hypothetical protein
MSGIGSFSESDREAAAVKKAQFATEGSAHVQLYPMLGFYKDCFFSFLQWHTVHVFLNRWRSVMQLLFNARHPQAAPWQRLSTHTQALHQ